MTNRPLRRLLFVADDPETVEFCASVAEPFGFVVRRAGDREGLEKALESFGPDAVLFDPDTHEGDVLAAMSRIPATGATLMLVGAPESRSVRSAKALAEELGLAVAGLLARPVIQEGLEIALRALSDEGLIYSPAEIAEAVMRGDITAWYQPQVRRAAGGWRIDGAEALARWQHPDHGLVLPDAFIPTAEAEGQIAAITDCVLRTSLEQLGVWQRAGMDLRVCAKLTPDLVTDPDFPDRLVTLVREYDVRPASLVIQVPETGLQDAAPAFRGMLARLRVLGFGVAMEHFGAGVSSVSELYQTPFSELKLDSRISARLPGDQDAVLFARAVVGLAQPLGLTVTAEAVETAEALAALEEIGCERAQGYAVSRPLPATEFQAMVREWNRRGGD